MLCSSGTSTRAGESVSIERAADEQIADESRLRKQRESDDPAFRRTQQSLKAVEQLKDEHSADDSWVELLSAETRQRRLFTSDVQEAFTVDSLILIVGFVNDMILIDSEYHVRMSTLNDGSILGGFQLRSDRSFVEQIKADLESSGLQSRGEIAAVARVTTVEERPWTSVGLDAEVKIYSDPETFFGESETSFGELRASPSSRVVVSGELLDVVWLHDVFDVNWTLYSFE